MKTARCCIICGALLIPKQGRSKYCSRACGRKAELIQSAKDRKERGVSVIIGEPFPCRLCSIPVIAKGPKSRYCEACSKVARRETFRKHNNSEVRKSSLRERRANDPKYALDRRMGWSIWYAMKSRKNGRKWEDLVDFTIEDLVRHLELQFRPGMNWQNMGDWHIDHIRPRASFQYTDEADAAFKECWSLSNLMPLWGADNIAKGAAPLYLI